MPYRQNAGRFQLYNEGLGFLDSLIYQETSEAAWPVNILAEYLAKFVSLTNPQSLSARQCPLYGWIIKHRVGQHLTKRTKQELAETDQLYSTHHDQLLESLLRKERIAERSLRTLIEEFIYGRQDYELEAILNTSDAERYWQSLLIDYALTQDSAQQVSETVSAAAIMHEVCFSYVTKRLFENKSYHSLSKIQQLGQQRTIFEEQKQRYFDQFLERISDTEALGHQQLFLDFGYRPGLERALRVNIIRGNHQAAQKLARQISAGENSFTSELELLSRAYTQCGHEHYASELEEVLRFCKSFFREQEPDIPLAMVSVHLLI